MNPTFLCILDSKKKLFTVFQEKNAKTAWKSFKEQHRITDEERKLVKIIPFDVFECCNFTYEFKVKE